MPLRGEAGMVVEEDIKAEAVEVVARLRFVHIPGETEATLKVIEEAVRIRLKGTTTAHGGT